MRRLPLSACLAVLGLVLLAGSPVSGQGQATAVVTTPQPGATVSGVVTIAGTAAAPRFLRYEVAFGYENDPTGTWFSLFASTTPVTEGPLAVWGTGDLTAGLYVLRVRVYTSEREYVETLVRGIRVRSAAAPGPTESGATPGAPTPAEPPTRTPTPTATAPLIALPPAPMPSATPETGRGAGQGSPVEAGLSAQVVQTAFGAGVQLTFAIFSLLGVYLGLRAALLAWWRRRPQR